MPEVIQFLFFGGGGQICSKFYFYVETYTGWIQQPIALKIQEILTFYVAKNTKITMDEQNQSQINIYHYKSKIENITDWSLVCVFSIYFKTFEKSNMFILKFNANIISANWSCNCFTHSLKSPTNDQINVNWSKFFTCFSSSKENSFKSFKYLKFPRGFCIYWCVYKPPPDHSLTIHSDSSYHGLVSDGKPEDGTATIKTMVGAAHSGYPRDKSGACISGGGGGRRGQRNRR